MSAVNIFYFHSAEKLPETALTFTCNISETKIKHDFSDCYEYGS